MRDVGGTSGGLGEFIIGLVMACVGGYLAPFVRMNGADLPAFDFALPGVRSMSADLHKYGYCSKGASTAFFRDAALMDFMRFDFRDWPGGRMVTPTLAGTRPGGAISSAWAVMTALASMVQVPPMSPAMPVSEIHCGVSAAATVKLNG